MSNVINARFPTFRHASESDIEAIAGLHAESWRRHYRGAYRDEFLDGDVFADRQATWAERLSGARADRFTIVAEMEDGVAGFVHMVLDDDPKWGALLDNLHVTYTLKRRGIGSRLLAEAARELIQRRPDRLCFYLWVLDQNKAAQSFYAARGGVCVETAMRGPFPGGGTALGRKISWPDAGVLLPGEP
ncbi:MAG TPA: GNAT family N-acetyltransferase [Terriglobia bacterium]|nr:GNAT family N-acetyltransferase [Terriglobia bacterium]